MTIDVKERAEDNLPDYPTHDDVPLTEDERNRAIDLLLSLNVVEREPTRMVKLTDTDIEVLQHGLFLLRHVLQARHEWLLDNEADSEYGREILDSLRNVRLLYGWLENAKDQLPI